MLKFLIKIPIVVAILCSPIGFAGEGHMHSPSAGMDNKAGHAKSLDEDTKKQFAEVMEAYDTLHQSFFKYDKAKVQADAKRLHDLIKEIKHPEISKILKYSSDKLPGINASKDREANNQIYHTVSMSLVHVLRTFDTGLGHEPFYCPMVKMKWIQNPNKINGVQNPYASDMPQCGGKDHT